MAEEMDCEMKEFLINYEHFVSDLDH